MMLVEHIVMAATSQALHSADHVVAITKIIDDDPMRLQLVPTERASKS